MDVVLVDEHDREVGTEEKTAAHEPPGKLHRAVSVVVFDRAGAVLLQQRAHHKHHFTGLWSNSCCTHPGSRESPMAAGERRIIEEMGIALELQTVGTFIYRAEDPASGLIEHELDHVLVGTAGRSSLPDPDPYEVADWKWMAVDELQADLRDRPQRYTPWFPNALELALAASRRL